MTWRRRALLLVLFGSVFLGGILAFAPASLMGYALEQFSAGQLSLAQTTGSLWQGGGVGLLRQKGHFQALGSYRWQLHLLTASLQLQSGESAPMTVHYAPLSGRLAIDNLRLNLPVSIMEVAAPQLRPYQLQGTLEAHSDHLILDASGLNGQIAVDWGNAASSLSQVRPLGNYRILLQGNGAAVDAQLQTLSGKLQLAGTGRYDSAKGMQLNGTAQAAPGAAAEELNELLHHIGPEVSPGVFTLALMPQAGAR